MIRLIILSVLFVSACEPHDYESCIESKMTPARTESAANEARNICHNRFKEMPKNPFDQFDKK